jgi:hypothetical protein
MPTERFRAKPTGAGWKVEERCGCVCTCHPSRWHTILYSYYASSPAEQERITKAVADALNREATDAD